MAEAKDGTAVELRLLEVVWRWLWLIALFSAIGAAAGIAWAKLSNPVYQAEAEVMARFAYEYTPPNTDAGGDNMQIRIDAEGAIETEIQIAASRPVIIAAMRIAPHKVSAADGDRAMDNLDAIARKISVARIEGTNLFKIAVTDEDKNWVLVFTQAIYDQYIAHRQEVFSNDDQQKFFADQIRRENSKLSMVDGDIFRVSNDIRQFGQSTKSAIEKWASAGAMLLSEMQDAAGVTVQGGDNGSQQSGNPSFDGRYALLLRLLNDLLTPGASADSGSPGTPALNDAIVVEAAKVHALSNQLTNLQRQRQRLQQTIATSEDLLKRAVFRAGLDHRVVLVSPPALLSPVGLPASQKAILAAAIGLFLGITIAVILDSLRQRKRAARIAQGEKGSGQTS